MSHAAPLPLSPRTRRLRWTVRLLCAAGLAGALIGGMLYLRSRPTPYRPDERLDAITSDLARGLPADAPPPKLANVTREAGLADFRNFKGERTSQLPEDMGSGLAWGDYDNDGDDDLFLVSAGGALNVPKEQLEPCALFENLGNGTFRRVQAFPELRIRGMAATWGDYDGDGFLDVAVTGFDTIQLFHNNLGHGAFTRDDRLSNRKGFWTGAAWGDFNHDRRLDLYVCNYVEYAANEDDRDKMSDQLATTVPYTLNPASYPPGCNALFRQNRDGSFTDVSDELSVQNPEGRSLGATWHDFDQDGWLDLYVANDVSDNVLFHNAGGRFEDLSHPAWVADYRSAMGLAIGDMDRDGDDDLYVTHWVAQENALYENMWANFNAPAHPVAPQPPPRFGRGGPESGSVRSGTNQLRLTPATTPLPTTNKPIPLRFVDIADQKGLGQVALPFVGWGAEFVDLDQDGWLDLLTVNGSTLEAEGPRPRKLQPQAAFLFWNRLGEFFHNLAPLIPAHFEPHVSRGLACADYDNDGDMDYVVADLYEGVRLLRNDMAVGHWLKLRLRSQSASGVANGFGDGTTAIAWVEGVPLRRTVGSVSYLSQSSHTLHWGVGAARRVDRLEVRWHAGHTNTFGPLDTDAFYEIVEGDIAPHRLPDRTPTTISSAPTDDKQRLVQFWKCQRAAMEAMKVDQDVPKAIELFRNALTLNPRHEDSRYYLGLCLASQGNVDMALTELATLQGLNPQSHRAWQQWGIIRALAAKSTADLTAAEQAVEQAHRLNPEETGALLVLGDLSLRRGEFDRADEQLAAATHTNPKAVGGFFLRAYLAWRRGDAAAVSLLEQARQALGPDWQPKGATSEGDVKQRFHIENSPLARFWNDWDGKPVPESAFKPLHQSLAAVHAASSFP